jgi:hypothetical protein|tara:strand:+ start:807 stop:1061 length:255 start_codon:yes stop_codon:yes gene_type:complete
MHPNYKDDAVRLCECKTSAEIIAIICEAKINGAPPALIQHMQQILDLSSRESRSLEIKETVLSAWTNYCRTSWVYRLLERFGFR